MADLSKFGELIEDFAKDHNKESGGVWMTYKRHQFLVARSHRNNVKFFKMMEKEMRPYQWAIDRGNFAAVRDAANELVQVVYASTVLLGIRKLSTTDAEGKAVDGVLLDYKPEDGVALFKQLPDLWDEVFKFSNNEANYAPDQVEQDAKN